MGDDCVNICGDYHLVTSATDTQLRVLAKQGMDIVKGDLVELELRAGGGRCNQAQRRATHEDSGQAF